MAAYTILQPSNPAIRSMIFQPHIRHSPLRRGLFSLLLPGATAPQTIIRRNLCLMAITYTLLLVVSIRSRPTRPLIVLPRREAVLAGSSAFLSTLIQPPGKRRQSGGNYVDTSVDGAGWTASNMGGAGGSWIGTNLPHLSPFEALSLYTPNKEDAEDITMSAVFPMGRWPDPVLRTPTQEIPSSMFNTNDLHAVADTLRRTSRKAEAVGLAAQQCGIDGSLIFLESDGGRPRSGSTAGGTFLVNPRFVYRSPEQDMLVWEERCLVLPPNFRATVLRDKRVIVEAETLDGTTQHYDLTGELARAVQHECQHDEGILIIDHVDLVDEMSGFSKEELLAVEGPYHHERQRLAFDRHIVAPYFPIRSSRGGSAFVVLHVSKASRAYRKERNKFVRRWVSTVCPHHHIPSSLLPLRSVLDSGPKLFTDPSLVAAFVVA